MLWRLTFDSPYDWATETGHTRAQQARDFRPEAGGLSDVWLDQHTGLAMLQPQVQSRDWHTNAKALSTFRKSASGATWWRESKRSPDLTAAFTNTKPSPEPGGAGFLLIELLVELAIVAIQASLAAYDTMKWVLESLWTLAPDEGFAIYLHGMSDEWVRKNNLLYLQWDNIGIHFDSRGTARAYMYDREDWTAAPTLWYEWQWADPGQIIGKPTYITCIPIPTVGLLVQTLEVAPSQPLIKGGFKSQYGRGHLVPWPSTLTAEGHYSLFNESPLRIGLNPYQEYEMAVMVVRYPESGTLTDAPFAPPYKPSIAGSVSVGTCQTIESTATGALLKADASGAWVAGTDHKARAQLTLTTGDTRYTPFVYGYSAHWDAVHATRNTTAVTPDVTFRLELTDDYRGRIEGTAEVLMQADAAQAIALRGDATCLVEYSTDSGSTWTAYLGGLAKDWRLESDADYTGYYYRCTCALADMTERLREMHEHLPTAFDGMTLGDALTTLLTSSGFAAPTIPAALDAINLPATPDTNAWRYSVREGDDGEQILDKLLLYGRRQWSEWMAQWDWDGEAWAFSERPRDTGTPWALVCTLAEEDIAGRAVRYSALRLEPQPPDANVLRIEGSTRPDGQGRMVVATVVNPASLTDDTSPDYLGRVVLGRYRFDEGADQATVNLFARLVYARFAHRNLRGQATVPLYVPGLGPNVYVQVQDVDAATIASLWCKRRTVVVTEGADKVYEESMTLELEEVWEGDLP